MKTFISAPNHDQAVQAAQRLGLDGGWFYIGDASVLDGHRDYKLVRVGNEIPTHVALHVHHARASGGTVIIEEVRL